MKKISICFILILLVAGTLMAQISRGGNAWVSARTVTLKSSTDFFASNRGTISYGEQVSVLQVSGNWAEVRSAANQALTGWMNSANLSARRIVSSGSSSATASEVALAGKGFDRDTENAFKAQGNLNYAEVDRVEAISIPQDELLRFVTEGRLARGNYR